MGLFGKRKSREERGLEIANKVASGKGFYGRMTKSFVGAEDFAKIQQSVGAVNSGIDAQQLLAMGAPTITALVVSVHDTGRLVNYDPVVDLVLRPIGSQHQIVLQTIVSKLRVPRPGEQVRLLHNPRQPDGFLYAGVV
jgi:hypothetical protein